MQDFIRIGGAITSSPLNEDFRRLLNAISIANTNLVFPEGETIVNTITDMQNIVDPIDAQACYVISSGELYRYSKKDNQWHKIMDIGQTFRQGFLNSGAVVLEDKVKLVSGSHTLLQMPSMLVYFKNQPGDDRYLKGMYLIPATQVNISDSVSGGNAYSFAVNSVGTYTITPGMPDEDNVNNVYIGSFITDSRGEITGDDFVYTLPDIAYTADRGHFIMDGGKAVGLNLTGAGQNKVNRAEGYYYDEGINYAIGATDDFPVDTDNGSNYNLKKFNAETPTNSIYYMVPENGFAYGLSPASGLLNNKYWNTTSHSLVTVPEGYFTVQQHLVVKPIQIAGLHIQALVD